MKNIDTDKIIALYLLSKSSKIKLSDAINEIRILVYNIESNNNIVLDDINGNIIMAFCTNYPMIGRIKKDENNNTIIVINNNVEVKEELEEEFYDEEIKRFIDESNSKEYVYRSNSK